MMKSFFFDTADAANLKRVWNDLKQDVTGSSIVGVTVNPAILARAGAHSLSEWLLAIKQVDEALTEIKGNRGELHVQCPSSCAERDQVKRFLDLVFDLNLKSEVCLKIPPVSELLNQSFGVPINVTGLCEASTALKCALLGADYCSILLGRMAEKGLDYFGQITFLTGHLVETDIIAGAMRRVDQVEEAFLLGTVPTIGLKVWDLILKEKALDKLCNLSNEHFEAGDFATYFSDKFTQLSLDFFTEMDKNGEQAFQDFLNL
jgi:transaldolase